MNKKTKIYYIIGVLNDRIYDVYDYQFISRNDIFNDITRLKLQKSLRKGLTLAFIFCKLIGNKKG